MFGFQNFLKFHLYFDNDFYVNNHIKNYGFHNGLIEYCKENKTEIWKLERQKKIKGNWYKFFWWHENHRKIALYRMLKDSPYSALKSILKTGNDRHDYDPTRAWDRAIFKHYGLRPFEFIWAAEDPDTAFRWGALSERIYKNPHFLFIVYNRILLKNIDAGSAWKLKEGVKSFKQALLAVVFLYTQM